MLYIGLLHRLLEIRRAMDRRQWHRAEQELRRLLLLRRDGRLNLLLAELYLQQDALGNSQLADDELDRAEETPSYPIAWPRRYADFLS